jgi:hypothetical protein
MHARLVSLCLAVLLAAAGRGVCAQAVDEYDVKVAYLYNFCNYVRWPEKAAVKDEIVLGIVGSRPSDDQIKKLNGRALGDGKKVVARRLTVEDLKQPLHLVFVSGSDDGAKATLAEVAKQLLDRPVLVVAEHPDAATIGTVRFVWIGGTIKFTVDRRDAARRNLELNAKLLRLAVPPPTGSPSGGP